MGLFDKLNFFKRKLIDDNNNIISKEVKVKGENLSEEVYPLAYSVGYLKNRTTDLVSEETGTAERIKGIEESFIEVRGKAEEISGSITNFTTKFNEIEKFSEEFDNKIINTLKSVQAAQSQVSGLKENSQLMEESFEVVDNVFVNFEKAYMVIREYTNELLDIANKANSLTLNASNEVGNEGTFDSNDVKELSEKIKKLGTSINVNIEEMESDTNQINVSLKHFQKIISKNYALVDNTEKVFENIKTNVYGVNSTNILISVILNKSIEYINNIDENVKKSNQYYNRVTEYIGSLNNQMTNKGIIFEDIANFLDQMDYLLDDIDNKR